MSDSETKKKIFKKAELQDKTTVITINKVNKIIKDNIDKLQYYDKLLDVSQLQVGHFIKYINLSKDDGNLCFGGTVTAITKKPNNDYKITIKGNVSYEWYILASKSVLFYKTKTSEEIRKEKYEAWKKEMKKDPEKYEEWKKEKEEKEKIRKEDPELYKQKYQHYRTSKKKFNQSDKKAPSTSK